MTTPANRRSPGTRLPSRGRLVLALGALVFLPGGAASAQEVVAISPEVHLYNSPLVLEYSLDETIRSAAPVKTTRLADHSCRGVTIESLVLQMLRVGPDRFLSLNGTFVLFNNSGKDKKADLTFDLLAAGSDEALSSTLLRKVDVEAGKSEDGKVKVPIPTAVIPVDALGSGEGIQDAGKRLRLRITITLRDV
ncbi:MAG: hypothetical protein U0529_13540 [Thermoanaerobaculia bacterium]